MRKKILLSILCICMVLTMMPTVGYAVEEPDPLNLYVNGVLIYTTDTTSTETPEGVTGVSFDKTSKILTLKDANITNGACVDYTGSLGISADFPLTINLVGNNSILIAPVASNVDSSGISVNADLTITGGGGTSQ